MIAEIAINKQIRCILSKMKTLDANSGESKNLKVKLRTLERALIILQERI